MKKLFLLALLLTLFNVPSFAGGRCTGKKSCTACTNCSRCKHCGAGGSCGVCAPSTTSNDVYYSPTRAKKSSHSTAGGTTHVKGYYRKDGSYVKPHTRTSRSKR